MSTEEAGRLGDDVEDQGPCGRLREQVDDPKLTLADDKYFRCFR